MLALPPSSPLARGLVGAVLLGAWGGTPQDLAGQGRALLASQIAVSGDEASLHIELGDGASLEIAFRNGVVSIDGRTVGDFSKGDELETSWRALLGAVVSLDDGPLAEALREWAPPDDLSGPARDIAREIDAALDEALADSGGADGEPGSDLGDAGIDSLEELSVLESFITRPDRLRALGEALEGLSLDDVDMRIGEDVTIEAGEELTRLLIVIEGDVDVHGTIARDVIVIGGTVRVHADGEIGGDVRLIDARIEQDGGTVTGSVLHMEAADIESKLRRELEREYSGSDRDSRGSSGLFRSIGGGLSGLMKNLGTFLALALFAMVVIHFFPARLHAIAECVGERPGQSILVGLAGTVLLIPVWIVGIMVGVVSVIGIPFLFAWVPLFPVAAGIAGCLGLLAVAHTLGQRIADRQYPSMDRIRSSNAVHTTLSGLGALLVLFVAANVVQMGGAGSNPCTTCWAS